MDIHYSQKGFSLIEGLMVIAILGIIVSYSISGWGQHMAKKHVRASMETLYDTLKLARSESIKQRKNITLSFRHYSNIRPSWCYALSDKGNCDCRISNACTINDTQVRHDDSRNSSTLAITHLSGPTNAKYLSFEHIRGTASNSGSVHFSKASATGVVSINTIGFIANCSNTISGYPSC